MGAQCSVKRPPKDDKKGPSSPQNASDDIRDIYIIGDVLGSGAFGEVRECLMKNSVTDGRKEVRAVKIMENINDFDFFEDDHFLYAVMEKCEGGELFDQICKRRRFTEADAAVLCRQMLSALDYVHQAGIVHRDVKAENFLFEDKTASSNIKMIDFGMSAQLGPGEKLNEVCGSPHYLSPELLRKNYDSKADMWALGVLAFLMLYGRYPFDGKDTKEIVREIIHKKIPSLFENAKYVYSPQAVSFLQALLNRDPEARLTAGEALKHPWVAHLRTPSEQRAAELSSSSQPEPVSKDLLSPEEPAVANPMEAVRSAHRKVTLARQTAKQTAIAELNVARRAQMLKQLDEEYTAGARQSLRFTLDGRTNKANTRGDILVDGRANYKVRPEYSRHDKRMSTTPSRLQVDKRLALEIAAMAALDESPVRGERQSSTEAATTTENVPAQGILFSPSPQATQDWTTPVQPLNLPLSSYPRSGTATAPPASPLTSSQRKGFNTGVLVLSPPVSPNRPQASVAPVAPSPPVNPLLPQALPEEQPDLPAGAENETPRELGGFSTRKSKRAATSHVMSRAQEDEARVMAADLVKTFQLEQQRKSSQ